MPPLSMPDVWELPWLVVEELQVRRGLCGAWPETRKLSASMPEVCELPWLVVEWRDSRLWWEALPALLPLARERLSRWSMSSSRASLMYDSLYCFFSEVETRTRHVENIFQLLETTEPVVGSSAESGKKKSLLDSEKQHHDFS